MGSSCVQVNCLEHCGCLTFHDQLWASKHVSLPTSPRRNAVPGYIKAAVVSNYPFRPQESHTSNTHSIPTSPQHQYQSRCSSRPSSSHASSATLQPRAAASASMTVTASSPAVPASSLASLSLGMLCLSPVLEYTLTSHSTCSGSSSSGSTGTSGLGAFASLIPGGFNFNKEREAEAEPEASS